MLKIKAKLTTVVGMTLASVLGATTLAFASIGPNTTVTGLLKTGTKMTLAGQVDGAAVTITCTFFKAVGKTGTSPSSTIFLTTPPTISGCKDNFGGTDTIKTNATNGRWRLTGTSTMATLVIPKAGATFSSSLLSSCKVTFAPTAAASVKGAYNGVQTITVNKASISASGNACSSAPFSDTATVVLSPAPGKPPWG